MTYYEKLQELKRESSKINNQRLRLTSQITDIQASIATLQENYDKKEQELKIFNKINKRINRSTTNMIKEVMKTDPKMGIFFIMTIFIGCVLAYILLLMPIFSFTPNINLITSAILLSLPSFILVIANLNNAANKEIKKELLKTYGTDNISLIKKKLFNEKKELKIQIENNERELRKNTLKEARLHSKYSSLNKSISNIQQYADQVIKEELNKREYIELSDKTNNNSQYCGRSRNLIR